MSGGDFKAADLRPKSEGSMQGGFRLLRWCGSFLMTNGPDPVIPVGQYFPVGLGNIVQQGF